jgi:hypothetical protein
MAATWSLRSEKWRDELLIRTPSRVRPRTEAPLHERSIT